MWDSSESSDSFGPDDCSGSATRTRPANILTFQPSKIDVDLHLHSCSHMCQLLFVRGRRNVNIPEPKHIRSEMTTNLNGPNGRPCLKHCLEKYMNVRYINPHEFSSLRNSSTIQRKQESLVKYVHPVLSPDRKDIVLEVECGANKGLLYPSRLCGGSKGACILFQKSWLTPNQFQAVSGRESAKDWKRSIRHCGRSVKLLMKKGILAQHPEYRCQACCSMATTLQVSNPLLVKNMCRLRLLVCCNV
jgi:hypothetical protein